jgi:DNA-binding phage protein
MDRSVKRLDTQAGVGSDDDLYYLTEMAEQLDEDRALLVELAAAAVAEGYEVTHVAQAAKVARQTIYNWLYGAQ